MVTSKRKLILPRKIRLEASTDCQLKCQSCPTASGEVGKRLGVGFLKFSDFKNIVDKNPWISHIELSNWGEIFLNKELIKIIKYAYTHNVALHANNGTNLNTVDYDVLEALVKYKFRTLTCSIDGASQETYSIYRVKGNFQKVIENIKTINKFKAQYNSPYPILHWQFIAFGHNEHEIGKARRMAVDLNMTFNLKLSWDDLYTESFSPIKNRELIRKETGLGVANRDEFREKFGKEYILRNCCLELWINPQINYDGRVLGCSVNYWDAYGNALKDGLKECLNNEKINYARDMLMGKRESKMGVPCTQCKFYKRMKENKEWFTNEEIEEGYNKNRRFTMRENRMLDHKLTHQLSRILAVVKRRLRRGILILQKGSGGANRFFSVFLPSRAKSSTLLTSGVYPLRIPLPPDEKNGWKPYPLFRGFTTGLRNLSCHASALIQHHCPHPPHMHNEEELLLLLSGEVDLILPDSQNPDGNKRRCLKPGQFTYYPSFFAHTLQTTSEAPANYIMFKWHADSKKNDSALAFGLFTMFNPVEDSEVKDGFCPRLVFEGSTAYSAKTSMPYFHSHTRCRLCPS
ncbi:MAG: radical SAM protein [Candidatus Scalindua sp.]|nr:radical SAM protein [Candidatus Scalindua sp.]